MAVVILSFRVRQSCYLLHRVADGVVDAMEAALSVVFQRAGSLPDRVRAEQARAAADEPLLELLGMGGINLVSALY